MKRLLLITAVIATATSCVFAQDSLGDAARQVRTEKAAQPHAKIVVDDEIAPLKTRTPFPELNLRGLDNTGEICQSMDQYRKTHKKDEFESSLRTWYDDYDQMIRLYLKEQVLSQERRNDLYTRPQPTYTGDYRKYWEQVEARQRADELDRRRQYTDQATINRVQQGLDRVRNFLMGKGTTFDWFKVHRSVNDDY